MRSKKSQMMVVVLILIAVAGTILALYTISYMAGKADDPAKEASCRSMNALMKRFEKGGINLKELCSPIEKTIPTSSYSQDKEGAMNEISDMSARCWWMWLEGTERNMFERWPSIIERKEPCYPCYIYNIKRGIESFTGEELGEYMRTHVYIAKDTSEGCTSVEGVECGFCRKGTSELPFTAREVSSSKCGSGEQCYISTRPDDICINKGGRCMEGGCEQGYLAYERWDCGARDETCCVEEQNAYNYFQYVQSYEGPGAIIYTAGETDTGDEFKFKAQEETYSVSIMSPNADCNWDCWLPGGAGAAGFLTLGVGICIATSGGLCAIPLAIGSAAAAGSVGYSYGWLSTQEDINTILISPYNAVKDACIVQLGATDD